MSRHLVLVHGAAHTGECWELVEPELEVRGFTVHTPTLGGHRGNPRDPLETTMRSYIEDVRAVLRGIGEPVTLLGHSVGGFVVSGVAEEEAGLVKDMIYLSAFVPARFGQCSLTDVEPIEPQLQQAAEVDLSAGVVSFPAAAARDGFYHRCPPQVQDRAVSLLCPQPMRPLMDAITTSEGGLGGVHKVYVESTDDRSILPSSQQAMQRYIPFHGVERIDSDHSSFFSMPEELAAVIDRLAAD